MGEFLLRSDRSEPGEFSWKVLAHEAHQLRHCALLHAECGTVLALNILRVGCVPTLSTYIEIVTKL